MTEETKKAAPSTYMNSIAENPTAFLRTTEVWCVPKAIEGDPEMAIVMRYDEPGLSRPYPADASFISKIVLAKGPNGEKIMFMAATGLHNILHLIEVLQAMDFERVKWGNSSHAKGEFAAPSVAKHGYIITVKPDVDGKRGDTEAVVFAPDRLVDMNGQMIMTEKNEGIEPDWVLNWSFIRKKSGVHLVALTAGGKLLEMVADRPTSRRFRDITPRGVSRVNDVVTIPVPNGDPQFAIATPEGLYYKGNRVMGTGTNDIANLCYDVDTQTLWIRTRSNMVYRLWVEGNGFLTPEPWSNVTHMFTEAVSHKLLAGSGLNNPILTAWAKPREIPGKTENDPGKFTIEYFRMEVARISKPVEDQPVNAAPRVC